MHITLCESAKQSRYSRDKVASFAIVAGLVALSSCALASFAMADEPSIEDDKSAALSLIDAIGNQAQQNEAASQPDEADFEYNDDNGLCSITGYTGPLNKLPPA